MCKTRMQDTIHEPYQNVIFVIKIMSFLLRQQHLVHGMPQGAQLRVITTEFLQSLKKLLCQLHDV